MNVTLQKLKELSSQRRFEELTQAVTLLPSSEFSDDVMHELLRASSRIRNVSVVINEAPRYFPNIRNLNGIIPSVYSTLRNYISIAEIQRLLDPVRSRCDGLMAMCEGGIKVNPVFISEEELLAASALFLRGAGGAGPNGHNRNGALWFGQNYWWQHDIVKRVDIYDRITQQPHSNKSDTLLVACADPNYFFSMGDIYIESAIRHGGGKCSIHLVLCDFDDIQINKAKEIIGTYSDRISIGYTHISRRTGVHKNFYCIARFYEMSNIIDMYGESISCSVIFTDIDSVFQASISDLVIVANRSAIGYVRSNYILPWHGFRANMLTISRLPEHRDISKLFTDKFDCFLKFISGSDSYWYLDQAAIGLCLIIVSQSIESQQWATDISREYSKSSFQVTAQSFDFESKRKRLLDFLNMSTV